MFLNNFNAFQVTVIYEPSKFYSKFIEKTKSAKKRISIASLYIGTGKLEIRLVMLPNLLLIE